MKKNRYSINSWIFGNTPIEQVAQIAKRLGFDGLDISGEPDTLDLKRVKRALDDNGLSAMCINGNYMAEERVFCHNDIKMRDSAIEYGKKCVDMAVRLGTDKFLIVPSQVNGQNYYESKEADWKHAVESIREVAKYAAEHNIMIVLECVNKYEVTLVRTLQDGITMAKDIGLDNVKIIGDTFHMNLEELLGIHNAIRAAGDWFAHMHLGDNTREVPGRGCINWREIFIALNDIGYTGAITFEPLPQKLTLDEIFSGALNPDDLERELKFSINYLKAVENSIK